MAMASSGLCVAAAARISRPSRSTWRPSLRAWTQASSATRFAAALRSYDLDFAVTGRPPEDSEVEKTVIGDHPHIIVGPADHALARRKRIALKDLAEETFLLREQGSGTRLLMQRIFSDAGLSPNLGMEIGSNETIKQAVMAGLGIALISSHTVSAEIADGRLAAFNVNGLPVIRQWFVVKQRDKRLLPAARALWDFFATSGAEFLPSMPATTSGRAQTDRPRAKKVSALARSGPE